MAGRPITSSSGCAAAPLQVDSLRRLLLEEPRIARPPTPGECEALKLGLEVMSIPLAAYENKPARLPGNVGTLR